MVRFFSEHELAGACQRLETRFSQSRKLILAVPISKHREREKIEPVIAGLIKGLENTRLVGIAAATFQQSIRFIATVAAKVTVQQIDHGPQVTAFLDIYLKQIAQVVKGRTSLSQQPLLLDRGGLGVSLRDDDAPQVVAKLARHLLVSRLAIVITEANSGIGLCGFQKDAPAIVRHFYVIEIC